MGTTLVSRRSKVISYFAWSIAGCILLVCLLIALVGSLWVLKVALDEFMRIWGINMSDWWKDTPEDIKRAVKSIENRRYYVMRKFRERKISRKEKDEEIEKLEKRLDQIERLSA